MRFLRLLLVLTLSASLPAWGQGTTDCPWFRNPTAFGSIGTPGTDAFRGWSARVGQRVSSGASSGTTIYSTCAASNCPDITGHETITSSTYNTGSPNDGGTTCCNYGNIWDANDSRFQIISSSNAGVDQFTKPRNQIEVFERQKGLVAHQHPAGTVDQIVHRTAGLDALAAVG